MAASSQQNTATVFGELVKLLVSVIEEKDKYIKGHAEKVANLCTIFARELQLPKKECDILYLAALLHDIGMVCIPLEIMHKKEDLTEDELQQIRRHPLIAENMLAPITVLHNTLPIIRHHHERHDGSGYPDGLQGDKIPLGARIMTVVDSYCSMSAHRPQREPLSVAQVQEELSGNAGAQFDPLLVKAFNNLLEHASNPDAKPAPSKAASRPVAERAEETLSDEIIDNGDDELEMEPESVSFKDALDDILKKYKRGLVDLPVLPKVIQDIEAVMRKPNTGAEELSEAIDKDAVISVKLIAVANSPIYRGSDKIHTVKQAVPRLGMKETQNVVSTIAAKNVYKTGNPEFMLILEKQWNHALATAFAARSIAKKMVLGDADKFYLMGLVHDIGKVLLIRTLSEYDPPLELSADELTTNIQEAHAGFGANLLQLWEFTPDFINCAEQHDNPNFYKTTKKEVLVINLANMLTRTIGCGQFEDPELDLPGLQSAQMLGIDQEKLQKVIDEVQHAMAIHAEVL